MKNLKTLTTIFVTLSLILALTQHTTAQTPEEMQTFFSRDYAGISIQVNATQKTVPDSNIAISLWINCTADGVYADYLNLSVYGYRHFRYGLEKNTLNATCVIEKTLLVYNHTSEYNYTVYVPNDVWDLTYAELDLKYAIKGSPFQFKEIFPITTVRNVLWEELEKQLKILNESYRQLNSTFEQLNQTYWNLQQNYTVLQGSLGELDNARRVMTVLGITTAFFVVTTIYFVVRKPKKIW